MLRLGLSARNARLDALSAATGANARLYFYNGAEPASADLAPAGVQLVAIVLGAQWSLPASNGRKVFAVPVSGVAAKGGTGTPPNYFRLYDAAGAVCHAQGTIGTAAGPGVDLVISLPTIAAGQVVRLDAFELLEGNA